MKWSQEDADLAQKFANYVSDAEFRLTGKQIIDMFGCIKWYNKVCDDISNQLLPEEKEKEKEVEEPEQPEEPKAEESPEPVYEPVEGEGVQCPT